MEVVINKLGINGEGVAKLSEGESKDKVCFVPFSLPDEIVDIDIIDEKKDYCIGKINFIEKTSLQRITPKCKYFEKCGGCDLQHMEKTLQKTFYKDKVLDTLKKIGKIDTNIKDVIFENEFNYRNKMVFPFGVVDGQVVLGMFSANSHKIVNIDKCLLAEDNINKLLSFSQEFFSDSRLSAYDYNDKNGDLKYLVVRAYNKQILITIVVTKRIKLKEYFDKLQEYFKNYSIGLSLVISYNKEDVLAGKYIHLYGLESLIIEEFGIKYSLDNRGFLQVNNEVKHELYSRILKEIESSDNVIDAYSGAGLLSAIISKKCKSVVGIEINQSASLSAKKLAKENNLNNIKFIFGDVKQHIVNSLSIEDSVVILDPPRSGCDKSVLNSIISKKQYCKKIIYVSCNPATLARDLALLSQEYNVCVVEPYVMFPQTKHVETLVVLERKE